MSCDFLGKAGHFESYNEATLESDASPQGLLLLLVVDGVVCQINEFSEIML